MNQGAPSATDIEAEFFAALSAREIGRASACLSDHVLFLYPGLPPVHGRARTARALGHLRARFVDIGWTHAATLEAEPEWRIATWTVAGTRRGGGTLRAEVASVMRLDRHGRIGYLSDYFKSREVSRPVDDAVSLDAAGRLRSI